MAEAAWREHERHRDDINAWFFKETALKDLVAGAMPLLSIDDLAIDGLSGEEADSFLRTIEE